MLRKFRSAIGIINTFKNWSLPLINHTVFLNVNISVKLAAEYNSKFAAGRTTAMFCSRFLCVNVTAKRKSDREQLLLT